MRMVSWQKNSIVYKDLFDTKLWDVWYRNQAVSARRSVICMSIPHRLPQRIIFYKLSCDSNYIRRQRIKKDRKWTTDTEFGTLDITINLSNRRKIQKPLRQQKNAKAERVSEVPAL